MLMMLTIGLEGERALRLFLPEKRRKIMINIQGGFFGFGVKAKVNYLEEMLRKIA